ncbi:hypothetical protein ACIBQX_49615 [Nonomuraea sp. NPDC049714]|uniref:hypothetical protein n=1 Tax=Nonomuraea sp. NPDC049714 TaxID=3364357 RepID=UPI0037A6C386
MSDAHRTVHERIGGRHLQHHARSWRREILELAALFFAVGVAHLLATLLGHQQPGPLVLVGLGVALITGTAIHKRLGLPGRKSRQGPALPVADDAGSPMALWRVRMRVVERPGRLAAVAAAFGRLRCDILALHIAPTGSSAITPAGCDALDEFVVEAPRDLAPGVLSAALSEAGGYDVIIVPAQVKDLTDPAVQALVLAQRVGADPDRLPEALAELLRVSEIEWRRPGDTVDEGAELNTTMVISVNPDRALLIRRPGLPFTPTEAARAAALTAAARHARYSAG